MTKTEKYNKRMALRLNKVGTAGKKRKINKFQPQERKESTKVNKKEEFTKVPNNKRKLVGKLISWYKK